MKELEKIREQCSLIRSNLGELQSTSRTDMAFKFLLDSSEKLCTALEKAISQRNSWPFMPNEETRKEIERVLEEENQELSKILKGEL